MATISKWKALQNLLNTSFGTGILVMPYTVGVAGWYSFISVFLAFSMATYAAICLAKITIKTIERESVQSNPSIDQTPTTNHDESEMVTFERIAPHDTHDRVKNDMEHNESSSKSTFGKISHAALGKYGELYCTISYAVTFIILDIIVLIQSYEILQQILLYFIDNHAHMALDDILLFLYLFLLMLPTCFALNWNQMSWISTLSNLSVAIIVLMIIYVFIRFMIEFEGESIPHEYFKEYEQTLEVNIVSYAQQNLHIAALILYSFLVFVNSIAANGYIPNLTVSLMNERDVYKVIIIGYVLITFVYVLSGVLGYIVYGGYTHSMIINNFFNWPHDWLVIIVSITIFINLWGSYGIYSGLVGEIMFAFNRFKQEKKMNRRALGISMLALNCIIAYVSRNYLAFLFAVIGVWGIALGIGLTLVWVLYIGTFLHELSKPRLIFHIVLLIICVAIGIYVSYGAITGLL